MREAAQLLKVSEKTIYRWIEQDALPAYRVHDQYRMNRVELLEWATERRIKVPPDIFREGAGEAEACILSEALRAGGVVYGLGGRNRSEVLRAVVRHMSLPETVDRDFLFRVLEAREELGSTGIGDGIAIPHVRNPLVLHVNRPIITLCFLDTPVDFGALDGKPVHALFTLVTPTIRVHLHLLSRLSFALRDSGFGRLLKDRAPREEIFTALTRIENNFPEASGETEAAR